MGVRAEEGEKSIEGIRSDRRIVRVSKKKKGDMGKVGCDIWEKWVGGRNVLNPPADVSPTAWPAESEPRERERDPPSRDPPSRGPPSRDPPSPSPPAPSRPPSRSIHSAPPPLALSDLTLGETLSDFTLGTAFGKTFPASTALIPCLRTRRSVGATMGASFRASPLSGLCTSEENEPSPLIRT